MLTNVEIASSDTRLYIKAFKLFKIAGYVCVLRCISSTQRIDWFNIFKQDVLFSLPMVLPCYASHKHCF